MLRAQFTLPTIILLIAGHVTGVRADLLISTFGGGTLGPLSFQDEDVWDLDIASSTGTMILDGSLVFQSSPPSIESVFVRDNGNIVFSTGAAFTFDSETYETRDLVEYDAGTGAMSLFLDGSAVFTPVIFTRINGAHELPNGNVLLTTIAATALDGSPTLMTPDQIIEYNPTTHTGTVFFDGNSVFDAVGRNVDGVSIAPNGNLLLTVRDAAVSIGSLTFFDEDVVEYNFSTGVATMFLDGSNIFTSADQDVHAIHHNAESPLVPEPSGLMLMAIGTFGLIGYRWRRVRKQRK